MDVVMCGGGGDWRVWKMGWVELEKRAVNMS